MMPYLGKISLLLVSSITTLAFWGLIGFSGEGADFSLLSDSYFYAILGFSLKQATLSALLSILLAYPIARALYYAPKLPFKPAFLSLCLLAFVMPTLVLITGLVALLGHAGMVTPWLGEAWNLYGLQGILIAHIYLNMPFAIRALLQQLNTIPDTSWRLAAQLKLSSWQRLWLIELPALRGSAFMLFGFVFVLCFNSFAVVLALGGGPQATTLEVAIYQALKYDFNIPEALTLAWVQFAIAGVLFLSLARFGSVKWLSIDTHSNQHIPKPSKAMQSWHYFIYAIASLFLVAPLFALILSLIELDLSRFDFWAVLKPTFVTLVLGFLSASIGLGLAYCMLFPIRQAKRLQQTKRQIMYEWLSTHTLVAPAMVLSVGLYIYLLQHIDVDMWGILWVLILNTVIIIPFAIQHLRPRLLQFDAQYQQLCDSLKLSPVQRLSIELRWMKSTLLSSFALVLLLAMGDVAIFSIFGHDDWMTLPWLIYSYAGTYRIAEASLASFILLAICAVIVFLFERMRHVRH